MPAEGEESNWAFFPLYPLLIRALGSVTGDYYRTGLLVSNSCFLAACWMMYLTMQRRYGRELASASVVALAVFPGSLVFSAFYTESLFLLLCVSVIYCLDRQGWWRAAMLVGLAGATRSVGVTLAGPLLLCWICHRARGIGPWRAGVEFAGLLGVALSGLGGFMAYQGAMTGDPLAFAHVQTAWDRHFINPFSAVWEPFWQLVTEGRAAFTEPGERPAFAWRRVGNVSAVVVVVLCLASFRRYLRPSDWLLLCGLGIIPLLSGIMSISRYIMVLPFLYPAIGRWGLTGRQAPLVAAILAMINAVCMASFATGRFLWQ